MSFYKLTKGVETTIQLRWLARLARRLSDILFDIENNLPSAHHFPDGQEQDLHRMQEVVFGRDLK